MRFELAIFIFLTILQAMTPYFTRKTAVFGVFIPEPFVQHHQLLKFKKQYSKWLGSLGGVFTLLQIILLFTSISEGTWIFISFILLYMMLILSSLLYMVYHARTKKLKQKEDWEGHVKTVHVMDVSLRAQDETLLPIFYTVPIIITLALITYTYMHYATIPDVFATHWNAQGEIDGWTEKTWISVIELPLLLLGMQLTYLLLGIGMKGAKIQLSAQEKEASANRERHQRKYGSWYLAAINLGVTILLVVLQYTTIILQNETASYFFPLFIGFMMLTFSGLLLFIWRIRKSNERFDTINTNETVPGDDLYWKWGIFYINKDDPALLIQKKFGIGWTVNLGNKWSFVIILLTLLPILLIIFI
ncbi:DUF1648 domain-containing protein [Lysinibacillus sphaericus]|uniref:DUF1648 domain-containing protein n=1 Tax=Lysinibacillus sphaericus OT4b.31 TaxID=1285586 RepID=R7ZCU7_LYSSH|nr:DUF1648 domain-containing protein [Lysinibacillus sphaericus]EON71965.1 hypothetical protein H131_13513 [Lysinibacillus sphaericus OT4b.31]